ncbi:hemerythrin HHE cation-binding protein [Patescibacteria group bacterium]|nr:MAG: hemerythrin HHE cation-binding protein [Patescibacteria group bacterium]
MHPIEDLTKEHGPIKLMLRILERINEKIVNGEPIATADLNDGVTFIKEFADKCHHGKEEALLFPAMKKNNIRKEIELIDILVAEHAEGRGYVKNIVEAISQKGDNLKNFAEVFVDNSKKYITLLDQHIDKENVILFPEANASLSEAQLKELASGFENVEKNIIGEKRHEELYGIVHKLKATYL